mgnify:CR=1 FL=1|tara:strand:+ start:602 stop:847 length:246 start_codon:yes stop_codon:yes gene_type:complete
MKNNRTVNGWDFEFVSQNNGNDQFYQCRGATMYDEEHDQIPEPSLWKAAEKLENEIYKEGFKCEAGHSEKGWVEVTIYGKI